MRLTRRLSIRNQVMTTANEQLVIVTGASSGIGLATVSLLLDAGYHVLGLSRHFDDPMAEHERFTFAAVDLSDVETLPAQLTELVENINLPVAALFSNAGIGKIGFLEQLSFDDLQVCLNTNFLSHAMLCKALIPRLKKQGHGLIVFTGSEAALSGSRQGSIYCASKFALRGFAQSLREECNRAGIRISIINPGATDTAFFDDLHYQPGAAVGNVITPEQIANTFLFILNAPANAVIDEINLSPLTRVWERN